MGIEFEESTIEDDEWTTVIVIRFIFYLLEHFGIPVTLTIVTLKDH
jgi:hypothetical protein